MNKITESFKILDNNKENEKELKKLETMKEIVHKATIRVSSYNWRKHTPVHGWITMNYPSIVHRPLTKEYPPNTGEFIQRNSTQSIESKSTLGSPCKNKNTNNFFRNPSDNQDGHYTKFRINPEVVNENVTKQMESLIKCDHTQKFMRNYPNNDNKFIYDAFRSYENSAKNIITDTKHNMNFANLSAKLNKEYELGHKRAFCFLTTDDFSKRQEYINSNLMLDERYCTMLPKSCMLGPEPSKTFIRKTKKIGDISFEEDNTETENVKHLSRLPPENITEEWLKENLDHNAQGLNLENCYWLGHDLLSKLGRMGIYMKSLSLRNLKISNHILENILLSATRIKDLNLSNCTGVDNRICEIISKGHIEKLNLFGVRTIQDEGLEFISQMKTLVSLNIGLCKNITDYGLSFLSETENQTKLCYLNLTGLIKITNKGINDIITAHSATLSELVISLLPQQEVNGEICQCVSKCKNLTSLDLSGCNNITNDAVSNIFSSGLTLLENLNLNGIATLNDSTGISIMMANKSLRILRLSNSSIKDEFMDYLIHNIHQLQLLEINRTDVTENKIQDAINACSPNLRVIRTTNYKWPKSNLGLKIPLIPKSYVKPLIKGAKKPPSKKNEDKNPENQLKRLREEMKPTTILDLPLKPPVKKVPVKK